MVPTINSNMKLKPPPSSASSFSCPPFTAQHKVYNLSIKFREIKIMETSSKPKIQIPNNMKQSSSDSQSHVDSPHSPLRLNSPLPSDQGDPHESPPFVSPMNSPGKSPPVDNSMAIVAVDKFTQCTPQPSPRPHENTAYPQASAMMFNRAMREEGPPVVGKVRPNGRSAVVDSWKSRREDTMKVAELGFRISEVVLCLISFSVMAADKTQGWSGDSYDRYREYRFVLSWEAYINVHLLYVLMIRL